MTKIDVTQPITDFDGSPIESPTQICTGCNQVVEGIVMTLRLVCTSAAVYQAQNEPPLPGEESVKRFALGMRIYDEDEPDLSAEDLALLKKRIAAMRPPIITARAWGMLDPTAK